MNEAPGYPVYEYPTKTTAPSSSFSIARPGFGIVSRNTPTVVGLQRSYLSHLGGLVMLGVRFKIRSFISPVLIIGNWNIWLEAIAGEQATRLNWRPQTLANLVGRISLTSLPRTFRDIIVIIRASQRSGFVNRRSLYLARLIGRQG